MQTSPNTYTIKRLANFKESLVDDKGEIIPLPIGKKQVTAFKRLYFYDNGKIIAVHKRKDYGFNADLTPIRLEIEGEDKPVTAFDWLEFSRDGKIIAEHGGKYYGFNFDLTPIRLLIKGDLVTAFGYLRIDPDGRIIAEHGGKYYGFNADLTPILTSN